MTPRHDHDTPGPVAREFITLGQALLAVPADTGVVGVLDRVLDACAVMVPAADVVSVTVRDADGQFHTPAETDPVAATADRIQYETGEGPCVEATRASGPGWTASSHLAVDRRYPAFGPRAAALGLPALFSTGMLPGGDPPWLGALNFYSFTDGGLDDADPDMALILASHAAVALHATRSLAAERLHSAQMQEALQSRDVIGQAKGILMERRGYTAQEAFDVLRRTSQDLNVKLRDVATTLANRRSEL